MAKLDTKAIVAEYGNGDADTGCVEVQVALLTAKIKYLTEHLKANKQDKHSTRGLLKMNSTRKKLLKYLERVDINRYRAIKEKLKLR